MLAPRFYTNDVTTEKLEELLQKHKGFAVLSAEGGEVISTMGGKYNYKTKGNVDLFLKGHAGDTSKTDRCSGREVNNSAPCLTLGLFVQPSVIRDFSNEFCERGLTQRFIFSLPLSFVGNRKISPNLIPNTVKDKYYNSMQKLIESHYNKEKVTLELSEDAKILMKNIEYEIEKMMGNPDISAVLRGWLSKLAGLIVRIAGLLHVANYVNGDIPLKIPRETLEKADKLRYYFIKHVEKALGIINESANIEDLQYILGKIRKFQEGLVAKHQDVYQSVKDKIGPAKEVDRLIDKLTEYNYAYRVQEGRKKLIYVNPNWR